MGIIPYLSKKKDRRKLLDPIFGEIEFEDDYKINQWVYTSKVTGGHMVIIDAPETGPSNKQREFYQSFKEKQDGYLSICVNYMMLSGFPINRRLEMSIYSVIIGVDKDVANGMFHVEISDEEAHEIHRIIFEDNEPVGYEVDD